MQHSCWNPAFTHIKSLVDDKQIERIGMPARWTVGQKLFASFSVLVLLIAGLGAASVRSIGRLGALLTRAATDTTASAHAVSDLHSGFEAMRRRVTKTQFGFALKELAHKTKSSDLEQCSACHSVDFDASSAEFNQQASRLAQVLSTVRGLMAGRKSQAAVEALDADLKTWQARQMAYIGQLRQDRFENAHAILSDELDPLLKDIDSRLAAIEQDADVDSGGNGGDLPTDH